MSSWLVTGAMGCLGAWTIAELLEQGEAVIGLDLSRDDSRLRAILPPEALVSLELVTADITDADALERVVRDRGIGRIVHLAALQIPFCRADPPLGARVNVLGTTNVFEVAARCAEQVGRVVYASSAAVYGPAERYPDGPVAEDAPLFPATHYGVFKRANEETARVYHAERGVASIGLRPYIVYGLGRDQGLTSGPTKAMIAAIAGRPYHIPFSGAYGYQLAADVARTFIACARVPFQGAGVFNCLGGATETSDIVAAIEAALPEAAGTVTCDESRLPFPPHLRSDGLEALLPDVPVTPIADGVRATIELARRALAAGTLDPARYA